MNIMELRPLGNHWIAFFDLSNDVLYTKNNIYKGLNYEYR